MIAAVEAIPLARHPLVIPTVESAILLLQALVIPVILVLFYLDGMVVGKITPPAALYVGYVTLLSPHGTVLFALAVCSVIAATLGQFTLYRGFNDECPEFIGVGGWVPFVSRIPTVVRAKIGPRRMRLVNRLFDRFGGTALLVTNAIPGIRSLMSIPAGLSRYPPRRFLVLSTVGNALYLVLLTAIARELVDLAAVFAVA